MFHVVHTGCAENVFSFWFVKLCFNKCRNEIKVTQLCALEHSVEGISVVAKNTFGGTTESFLQKIRMFSIYNFYLYFYILFYLYVSYCNLLLYKLYLFPDAKTARAPNGTVLYMFVMKALIGRTYICQSPRQFQRPPCSNLACSQDTCTDKEHLPFCDSVIGTHRFTRDNSGDTVDLMFREFVVYENELCYPEFLVEYVRA